MVNSTAPPFESQERFTVRRTAGRVLRPGEATTLSPSRDNIHTFEAGPHGARFVDLFSIHGQDVGFSYLAIEPRPNAAGGEISWPKPTRPGDVLRVASEVIEIRPSRSRPDRGTAIVRSDTRNQQGEIVQTLIARLVVPRRSARVRP